MAYNPDEPRDSHGRWTSSSLDSTKAILEAASPKARRKKQLEEDILRNQKELDKLRKKGSKYYLQNKEYFDILDKHIRDLKTQLYSL